MNNESIMSASAYNEKSTGTNYEEKDLSFPFSSTAPGSVKRVMVTAGFQLGSKTLDVDGCLGPMTYKAIKGLEKKETPKKGTKPAAKKKETVSPDQD